MRRARRKTRRRIVRYLFISLPVYAILVTAGILLSADPPTEKLLANGQAALRDGHLGAALEYLDMALAKSPDDRRIYWARAKVNEAMERFESALADYEEYRRLDPTSEKALNDIGWLLTEKADYRKAIERFEEAARRFPESKFKYRFNAGHVYYAWYKELIADAEERIGKIARTVMDPEPIRDMARDFTIDLEGARRIDDVLDMLPKGVTSDELTELQATLEEAKEHFADAHQALEPIYYATPSASNFNHAATIAELDYHAGRLDRAKLTCDTMLALDELLAPSARMSQSQRIKLLRIRANVDTDLERFDLSAGDFSKIEELHRGQGSQSEAFRARRLELQDRLASGQTKYVLENTRVRIENSPNDMMNAYLHARAQQELGDLSGAVQTALGALERMNRGALSMTVPRREDRINVVFGLFDILNAGSRWNEALRMLNVLLRLDRNNIEALRKRAIFYEVRARQYRLAGNDYFRLMELSPRDSELFAGWDRCNTRRLTAGGADINARIVDASKRWQRFRYILTAAEPSEDDWTGQERLNDFKRNRGSLVWDLQKDPYILYRVALHFMERQNLAEGLLILSRLANRYPKIHEFRFRAAQIAYARHDYRDALGRLQGILERNPGDGEAARYAILCLHRLEREEEARAVEASLVRAAPETQGRLVALRSALRRGEVGRADRILMAGLGRFPSSLALMALRGQILLAHGTAKSLKAADTLFRKVLERAPFQFEALAGAAHLAALKHDDPALRMLAEVIRQAPAGTLEDDIIEVAELLAKDGQPAIAAKFLRNARHRFPYSAGLPAALGRIYVRLDKLEDAENLLAIADEDDPSDPVQDLFLVKLEREGIDKATRYLHDRKSRLSGPQSMPSYLAIGHALRGARREAHRFLLRARELGLTDDPHATLMLLTRVLLTIDPIPKLGGLPPDIGAAPPLDPLAGQAIELRHRDFDWMVDLGLRDTQALRDLIEQIARYLMEVQRESFKDYAYQAIQKAYELQPGCGLAARLLAREAQHRGQIALARKTLMDQLRRDPADAESLTSLTELLRTTVHDAKEMATAVKGVADIVGNRSELQYLAARSLTLAGQIQPSIRSLQTITRKDPTYVPAPLDLAKLYRAMDQSDAAERALRVAVTFRPDSRDARTALVRFWRQNPENGRRPTTFLLPILKKNPALFDLYRLMIESQAMDKDGKETAEQLAVWLEPATRKVLEPEAFDALVVTGRTLLGAGRIELAETLLKRAERIDPLHPETLEGLGDLEYAKGRYHEAALIYDLLDKLYVAPAAARARLADLKFHVLHERAEGAAIAKAAFRRGAKDETTLEVLAAWEALNDRYPRAANLLRTIRPTNNDRLNELTYRVGLFDFLGKNYPGAVKFLTLLTNRLPEGDLHRDHAALLVDQIEKSGKAKEAVKRARLSAQRPAKTAAKPDGSSGLQRVPLLPDGDENGASSWFPRPLLGVPPDENAAEEDEAAEESNGTEEPPPLEQDGDEKK